MPAPIIGVWTWTGDAPATATGRRRLVVHQREVTDATIGDKTIIDKPTVLYSLLAALLSKVI